MVKLPTAISYLADGSYGRSRRVCTSFNFETHPEKTVLSGSYRLTLGASPMDVCFGIAPAVPINTQRAIQRGLPVRPQVAAVPIVDHRRPTRHAAIHGPVQHAGRQPI